MISRKAHGRCGFGTVFLVAIAFLAPAEARLLTAQQGYQSLHMRTSNSRHATKEFAIGTATLGSSVAWLQHQLLVAEAMQLAALDAFRQQVEALLTYMQSVSANSLGGQQEVLRHISNERLRSSLLLDKRFASAAAQGASLIRLEPLGIHGADALVSSSGATGYGAAATGAEGADDGAAASSRPLEFWPDAYSTYDAEQYDAEQYTAEQYTAEQYDAEEWQDVQERMAAAMEQLAGGAVGDAGSGGGGGATTDVPATAGTGVAGNGAAPSDGPLESWSGVHDIYDAERLQDIQEFLAESFQRHGEDVTAQQLYHSGADEDEELWQAELPMTEYGNDDNEYGMSRPYIDVHDGEVGLSWPYDTESDTVEAEGSLPQGRTDPLGLLYGGDEYDIEMYSHNDGQESYGYEPHGEFFKELKEDGTVPDTRPLSLSSASQRDTA